MRIVAPVSDAHADAHAESLAQPARFWARAAEQIEWVRRPRATLDGSNPPSARWFPGGMLNTCYNALDLHVRWAEASRTPSSTTARSRIRRATSPTRRCATRSRELAGVLRDLGVEKGDRVLVYMPMIPEAVIGMLACARIGAIHSGWCSGASPRASSPSASNTPHRR